MVAIKIIESVKVFAFFVEIDYFFSKSVDFPYLIYSMQNFLNCDEILFTPRLYKIGECQHPRISWLCAKWQKSFNS